MKPFYKVGNLPIVLASSAYYVPYMDITIKSIIDMSTPKNRYDIIVLHKEISYEEQKELKRNEKNNVSIRFLKIDETLDQKKFNYRPGYAPESFYRVVMPYILDEYDEAIWLDCDLIIKRDIADLFEEARNSINGRSIAACKDIDGMASCVCNHESRKQYMHSVLKLDTITDYFQSGVMYFNFKKIKEKYSLVDLVEASCNPLIMYGDQDVLNYLYNDDVYYLNMSWNTITNGKRMQLETLLLLAPISIVEQFLRARENPYILHLATKPWNDPLSEYAEDFWKYARRSIFYNSIIHRWNQHR